MDIPVYIIVNPHCHQGRGWKRWLSIRDSVMEILPEAQVIVSRAAKDLEAIIEQILLSESKASIISAGGDGSINALINILLTSGHPSGKQISVGAIGLGSSNDFLKPFGETIQGIPVRIRDRYPNILFDVGHVRYKDENNTDAQRYFIVNASMGVTAAANWQFNTPGSVLRELKKYFTAGAILYTAVSTIWKHRNIDCHIRYNQVNSLIAMSNINILKNPNVSGSFCYPQAIRPDDGLLGINICIDMGRKELLNTLIGLAGKKFVTGDQRISDLATSFYLHTAAPIVLECDGETMMANDIHISVLPKAIKILS